MMKIVSATIKCMAVLPDICSQVWKFSPSLTASVFWYILPNASDDDTRYIQLHTYTVRGRGP